MYTTSEVPGYNRYCPVGIYMFKINNGNNKQYEKSVPS